jgi:hypothetical protein
MEQKGQILAERLIKRFREHRRLENLEAGRRKQRFEEELREARKRRREAEKLARDNRAAKRNRIELEEMTEEELIEAAIWETIFQLRDN